jgi:hypothetical protein
VAREEIHRSFDLPIYRNPVRRRPGPPRFPKAIRLTFHAGAVDALIRYPGRNTTDDFGDNLACCVVWHDVTAFSPDRVLKLAPADLARLQARGWAEDVEGFLRRPAYADPVEGV